MALKTPAFPRLGIISPIRSCHEPFEKCPTGTAQPYDLRRNVTTDIAAAGVSHLVLKYLTAHATTHIMSVYVSIDPCMEMEKYFVYARPLLDAIRARGKELGCVA